MVYSKKEIDDSFLYLIEKMKKNKECFYDYIKFNKFYMYSQPNLNIPDEIIREVIRLVDNQKEYNSEILNELTDLNKSGLKIVGLKGIFLALRYYEKPEKRIFNDVDLLIHSKDAYQLNKILIENNFKINSGTFLYNNNVLFNKLKSTYIKNVHAIDYTKSNQSCSKNINLEIHSNFNVHKLCKFDMKSVFNNAVLLNNCSNIYVLNPYDELLFLMYHLVSHLFYFNIYGNDNCISLQNIYDICLICLYENIDFEILHKLSKKYKVEEYFMFVTMILNKLDIEFKNSRKFDMKNYKRRSIKYFKLNQFEELLIEDLIMGNFINDLRFISKMFNEMILCQNQISKQVISCVCQAKLIKQNIKYDAKKIRKNI